MTTIVKPPYRVPLMSEIRAMEPNGLTVASTFSGCGGSCLGFRMAGFSVVWACDFTPAAWDSYRANAAPDTYVDMSDIRKVSAEDILDRAGLRPGELDIFEGSPPCTPFSTAGKLDAGWGKPRRGSDTGITQRVDDLFFEYGRLLNGLQPRVFVAENVSGLVKGASKGYFKLILACLREVGYRVEVRLLDAQWLGVPQRRQRLIFIGVREDLGRDPVFPRPFPYRYSVRDALPELRGYTHESGGGRFGRQDVDVNRDVAPTITVGGKGGGASTRHKVIGPELGTTTGERLERRRFTIPELMRIFSFPDDFILTGTYAQQWTRIGNSVPPLMMRAVAETIRDRVLA